MTYAFGNFIHAKACLHTNPSDWIKKAPAFADALFFGASSRTRTYDNGGQKHSRLTRYSLRDTPCFFLSKPCLHLPPAAARLRAVNSRSVVNVNCLSLNFYFRNKIKAHRLVCLVLFTYSPWRC